MPLTFTDLQAINETRARRWHITGIKDWSPLEWAGAMAGEAGEACNAAKKLKRIEGDIKNLNTESGRDYLDSADRAREAIGKEVADTIIYGLLLLSRVGVDAESVIRDVFNKKSDEYGFPEKL